MPHIAIFIRHSELIAFSIVKSECAQFSVNSVTHQHVFSLNGSRTICLPIMSRLIVLSCQVVAVCSPRVKMPFGGCSSISQNFFNNCSVLSFVPTIDMIPASERIVRVGSNSTHPILTLMTYLTVSHRLQ